MSELKDRFRLEEEIIDVVGRLVEYNKFRKNAEIDSLVKKLVYISGEITEAYYMGLLEAAGNLEKHKSFLEFTNADGYYRLSVEKVGQEEAKAGIIKTFKNFFKK